MDIATRYTTLPPDKRALIDTVRQLADRSRRAHAEAADSTAEMHQHLLTARGQGIPVALIADALGVSVPRVYQILGALRVKAKADAAGEGEPEPGTISVSA